MRMCEDARDGVRRDLIEAQRKVRETEEQRDGQRKENLELKRGINAEVHEKKTVVKANEELRQQVKRAEQERIVLKVRALCEIMFQLVQWIILRLLKYLKN